MADEMLYIPGSPGDPGELRLRLAPDPDGGYRFTPEALAEILEWVARAAAFGGSRTFGEVHAVRDDAGVLREIVDDHGARLTVAWDAQGRPEFEGVTSTERDADGRWTTIRTIPTPRPAPRVRLLTEALA